jgi:hypothetical protein
LNIFKNNCSQQHKTIANRFVMANAKDKLTAELEKIDAFHAEKRREIESKLAVEQEKLDAERAAEDEARKAARLDEARAYAREFLKASADADAAAKALFDALRRRRELSRLVRDRAGAEWVGGNIAEHRASVSSCLNNHGIGAYADIARGGPATRGFLQLDASFVNRLVSQ